MDPSYDWPNIRARATAVALERIHVYTREKAERFAMYEANWGKK